MRHFLATGEGPILRRRIEITAVRRSGAEFPVELEVVPVKLRQDWVFSAFIRDITESRLAQEKLRASELHLRRMTETIPEMLWSATAEGAIDYCNTRVLDLHRLPGRRAHGRRLDQTFFIQTTPIGPLDCGCLVSPPERRTEPRFALCR